MSFTPTYRLETFLKEFITGRNPGEEMDDLANGVTYTDRKKKQRKTTILSHISKDDKPYDIPSDQPGTHQVIESEVTSKIIRNAIDQLTDKFKTVIILRDIQELSYEDISSIVGVPIGTIKSRINRARLQLQTDLKHLKK